MSTVARSPRRHIARSEVLPRRRARTSVCPPDRMGASQRHVRTRGLNDTRRLRHHLPARARTRARALAFEVSVLPPRARAATPRRLDCDHSAKGTPLDGEDYGRKPRHRAPAEGGRDCEAIEQIVLEHSSDDGGFEELVPEIRALFAIAARSTGTSLDAGVQLHRATNHHASLPREIDALWYPPSERAQLGRANRRGHSIFYCSADPTCIFDELGAVPGQLVVRATWVTVRPMLLHDCGFSRESSLVPERAGRCMSAFARLSPRSTLSREPRATTWLPHS